MHDSSVKYSELKFSSKETKDNFRAPLISIHNEEMPVVLKNESAISKIVFSVLALKHDQAG